MARSRESRAHKKTSPHDLLAPQESVCAIPDNPVASASPDDTSASIVCSDASLGIGLLSGNVYRGPSLTVPGTHAEGTGSSAKADGNLSDPSNSPSSIIAKIRKGEEDIQAGRTIALSDAVRILKEQAKTGGGDHASCREDRDQPDERTKPSSNIGSCVSRLGAGDSQRNPFLERPSDGSGSASKMPHPQFSTGRPANARREYQATTSGQGHSTGGPVAQELTAQTRLFLRWWIRIRDSICDADFRSTVPDMERAAGFVTIEEAAQFTKVAEMIGTSEGM